MRRLIDRLKCGICKAPKGLLSAKKIGEISKILNKEVALVRLKTGERGDRIIAGQEIGEMGNSGGFTGMRKHLHFGKPLAR